MQSLLWYIIILLIFTYLIYDTYKDGGWQEVIKFVIIFGCLFLTIRTFLIQPFVVEGPSMSPTFETNNYLIVNKFSMYIRSLERYEVVIFDIPDTENRYHKCNVSLPFTNVCIWKQNRYLIKRIIGLPKERIVVLNGVTTIYNKENPNGEILNDDYVIYPSTISDEKILSEDEYYVMGDNRANSSDSRYFGILKLDKIVGVPTLRLFPFTQIGLYPGTLDLNKK